MEPNLVEKLLNNINEKLDKITKAIILKSLLEYRESNKETIEKLVNTDILKAVWDVCDGNLNITEIGEKLGKNKGTISAQIKPWSDAKIVFDIAKNNSRYPINIDLLIESIIVSCIN